MSYNEKIAECLDQAIKTATFEGQYRIHYFDLDTYLVAMTGLVEAVVVGMSLGWDTPSYCRGVAWHLFECECSGGDYFRGMKVRT